MRQLFNFYKVRQVLSHSPQVLKSSVIITKSDRTGLDHLLPEILRSSDNNVPQIEYSCYSCCIKLDSCVCLVSPMPIEIASFSIWEKIIR